MTLNVSLNDSDDAHWHRYTFNMLNNKYSFCYCLKYISLTNSQL